MALWLAFLLCAVFASAQCVPCYGTFGSTAGAIVSSALWCVSGPSSANCGPTVIREIADPFSVNTTGPLVSITLGLQYSAGTNGVIITLAQDSGHGPGPGEGPGNLLESWTVTNLPGPISPMILTTVNDNLNLTLQGGQEYWLILQPIAADTLVGWYRTPGALNGDNLYLASANNGLGWVPLTPDGVTGTQSAFEVGGWQTGTLAHFAAGGGWTTSIAISNVSPSAELLEVLPLNESGNYITAASGVSATQTQAGVTSAWNLGSVLTLAANQSVFLTLTGGNSTVVGSVAVSATGPSSGYAVFHWAGSAGGFPSDGTVRLQTQPGYSITLPYDNTTGFVTGVALASQLMSFNPVQSAYSGSVTVKAVALDDEGNQLGIETFPLNLGGHTSFVMSAEFPASAGKRGVVEFSSFNSNIAAVGLRWTISGSGVLGTFTDVPATVEAPEP